MKHEQKQVYLRDIEIEHCIISPETYTFSFTVPPKIEILDHDKKTHTYDVIKLLDKLSKNIDVGELAYLQKENSDLKDEVDLLQKQLEIAVDALKIIGSGKVIEHSVMFHEDDNKIFIANKALEQITAEQKDK